VFAPLSPLLGGQVVALKLLFVAIWAVASVLVGVLAGRMLGRTAAFVAGGLVWISPGALLTVSTLAYPYGRSNAAICRLVEEVGFAVACGVEHWNCNLFDFSRIDAAACLGNTLLWRLKVSGIYRRLRRNGGLRALDGIRKRLTAQQMRRSNDQVQFQLVDA
jgi:hypothetical protein